jgi:lipopolysaccharide transport system ATP-binding protein
LVGTRCGARGPEQQNLNVAKRQGKQIEGDRFIGAKGIDLEVKQGEILGIIGKNGAGKSTLLKILSRVTAPTRGSVKIKGRVASLLEVGTGFHPELTGRENIFMNGAILGMSNKEIKKKFDEIVDFSGVADFIDTPVKRYSSGMYVRLAFAVAAHLDPEILVIDEVLAVGDVEFQEKCLGKMESVGKQGRTILFVSHNLPMIEKLCPQSVLN